jgi:hypothetical protein
VNKTEIIEVIFKEYCPVSIDEQCPGDEKCGVCWMKYFDKTIFPPGPRKPSGKNSDRVEMSKPNKERTRSTK